MEKRFQNEKNKTVIYISVLLMLLLTAMLTCGYRFEEVSSLSAQKNKNSFFPGEGSYKCRVISQYKDPDKTYMDSHMEGYETKENYVNFTAIAELESGIVYEMSLQEEIDADTFPIFLYVTDNGIYRLLYGYTEEGIKNIQSKAELFQSGYTIVCRDEELADWNEEETGIHHYISCEGDRCESHYYQVNEYYTPVADWEAFYWEKKKGLVYYRSGWGTGHSLVEIIIDDGTSETGENPDGENGKNSGRETIQNKEFTGRSQKIGCALCLEGEQTGNIIKKRLEIRQEISREMAQAKESAEKRQKESRKKGQATEQTVKKVKNSFFPGEGSYECSVEFENQDLDMQGAEPYILRDDYVTFTAIAEFDKGAVYEMGLKEEIWMERFPIFLYVTDDEIYRLWYGYTKEGIQNLRSDTELLQIGYTIVSRNKDLEDWNEQAQGDHHYVTRDGKLCKSHFYESNPAGDTTGYWETFYWEQGKGLVYYRSGYAALREFVEIATDEKYKEEYER